MAGEDKGQKINSGTDENTGNSGTDENTGNSGIAENTGNYGDTGKIGGISDDAVKETTKRNPVVRILALLLVLIYIVLLGIFIYFIAIQSEYILAMLFVIIVYPVVLYLLLWVRKVFKI